MNFLRTCSVIVVVGLLIMAVMAGCEWFDSSAPTEPTGVAEGPLAGNFIGGPAEDADWAGYYKPGQTYFKVTIPVIGTATIRYWLAGGGCFASYVQTLAPVTVEIGLLTHADGTVDRLGNVTVEYVAGGSFAALPEHAVAHHHADYVHYWRKDADETEHPWWLCDTSGFASEGTPHTQDIIRDGVLLVEQGLPAQRPEPEPAPVPTIGPSDPKCTVVNENDSGAGSLRQVLADAPANGCSRITFAPGVSTITLTSRLDISSGTLTIDGGSGVTVSGGDTTRVFWVDSGANVTFQNLTITNGQTDDSSECGTSESCGGGVCNYGTVTIADDAEVSGNVSGVTVYLMIDGTLITKLSGGYGGGICNHGTLTITDDAEVSDNRTGRGGGGIFNSGIVTIGGTVNGNSANYGGGGIYTDGTVSLVTGNLIQGNQASEGGGGICYQGGTITGTPNYGSGNWAPSGTLNNYAEYGDCET